MMQRVNVFSVYFITLIRFRFILGFFFYFLICCCVFFVWCNCCGEEKKQLCRIFIIRIWSVMLYCYIQKLFESKNEQMIKRWKKLHTWLFHGLISQWTHPKLFKKLHRTKSSKLDLAMVKKNEIEIAQTNRLPQISRHHFFFRSNR